MLIIGYWILQECSHIILLWCYPYVMGIIPLCHNPQVVFLQGVICGWVVGVQHFLFIIQWRERMLYQKEKLVHFELLFQDAITTRVICCIIVDQKRRYIGIIDIWCSCLVVWYYIFIWLLVLFGRRCTFFHLQGAFFLRG